MTAPSRRPVRVERVERWLREVAPLLRLADWTIVVEAKALRDDPGEEVYACVQCIDGHQAHVWLAPRFWPLSAEEQRRILVHELGHIVCARLEDANAQTRAALPGATGEAIVAGYGAAEEHIAEWIARVVAPTLPMPPKFTARAKR